MNSYTRRFSVLALAVSVLTASVCASAAEPDRVIDFNRAKSLATAPDHQFAEPLAVEIDSRAHGTWTLDRDGAVWTYVLHVRGANSVAFHAPQVNLPAGAVLTVNDRVHDERDISRTGMWSRTMRGELLELRAQMPLAVYEDFLLVIEQVQAGFRGVRPKASPEDVRNPSCYPNDDAIQRHSRATVLVSIANVTNCSGTIMNNSRNDRRMFVLSAVHCALPGNRTAGSVDAGPPTAQDQAELSDRASSLRIGFRLTAACGSEGAEDFFIPTDDMELTTLGATHRVGYFDAWLVEMDDPAPVAARPYYAGIDARLGVPGSSHPTAADQLFALTHANTQRQRLFLADVVRAEVGGTFLGSQWQATYKEGHQDAISGGASGSSLVDRQGRVSGTHYGSGDGCALPRAENRCPVYQQVSVSWARTAQVESLSRWLYPDAAPGQAPLTLAGLDSSVPTPTPTPTATPTATPTPTVTPTAMPTAMPTPTAVPTAAPTATPLPTATPTQTAEPPSGGAGGGSMGFALPLLGLLAFRRRPA